MTTIYLKPAIRKADIITHAVEAAREHGYRQVTRAQIARRAGVSDALVSRYWGTMAQMRRAIMRHAVREGMADVVAQGLTYKDNTALKAPLVLRELAAASLTR